MEINEQFELLKNIIRFSESADLRADISEIEKIIFRTLPNTLGKNAPPNFPELYFDFKQEYERFKEFILYERLIGKNVVALGGGFSSGKSSFLNSIMEEEILPSDVNPSTSVPTYIINGNEISAYGINTFQSKVPINIGDVMLLSHGFGKTDSGEEITLGHLVSSLFISTPHQKYDRIAMLDTPGYSKADSASYSAKTDEKIARTQLNSANYIMWFIESDAGTIRESDIRFIQSLRSEIPKLIILNKADKMPPDEVDDVIRKIRKILDMKGIRYLDVLAYSSEYPDDYDRDRILEYIGNWNGGVSQSRFAHNFKVIFTKCREYYEELLDAEKKTHSRLSHIIADVSIENEDASDYLNSMDNQAKRNIAELKILSEELKKLQNEFFTEIKRISDIVGIDMPEPSEIDLLQDKLSDPKEVLDSYCAKNGLDTAKNKNEQLQISMIISEIFAECKPVFNDIQGDSSVISLADEIEKIITFKEG